MFWIPAFAGMTTFMFSFVYALSLSDLDSEKLISGGAKLTKAAVGISGEDEQKIGREVAAYLAARYGMLSDPAKTKYVNLVGRLVARHSGRTDIPYHFGILKSEEINAWAAPGGYVFITEGLLNFLENEAQLAGVLAHEVSHISERHIVKAMRKADLLGAGQDVASATGVGGDGYTTLANFSIDLLNKGFSRSEELESDALGAVVAARAGYDPQAYRYALKRISFKTEKTDTLFARYHKTHPPIDKRLASMDTALKRVERGTPSVIAADRFSRIMAGK